jgi:hypothetical protein
MERMKDGAILANTGHFNVEIDSPALKALAVETREARAFGVHPGQLLDQLVSRDGERIGWIDNVQNRFPSLSVPVQPHAPQKRDHCALSVSVRGAESIRRVCDLGDDSVENSLRKRRICKTHLSHTLIPMKNSLVTTCCNRHPARDRGPCEKSIVGAASLRDWRGWNRSLTVSKHSKILRLHAKIVAVCDSETTVCANCITISCDNEVRFVSSTTLAVFRCVNT